MKREIELERELKEILRELYTLEWNRFLLTSDSKPKFNNIAEILHTPSLNKWFIEYNYPYVVITKEWIKYFEEQRKSIFIKFIKHIQNLWNFYSVVMSFLALIISIIALLKN